MSNLLNYINLLNQALTENHNVTLIQLLEQMKQDYILESMSNNKSKLNKYKLVKKYLEQCKKYNPQKTNLHNIKYDDIRNISVICNHYSMITFKERYEDLESPEALSNITNYINFLSIDDFTPITIDIDDLLPKLKIAVKLNKSKKDKDPFKIEAGEQVYYYNPEYLIWAIQILELKGEIEFYFDLGNNVSPIKLNTKNGDALILPVYKKRKFRIPMNQMSN
jgi:hypothetical protein